MTTAWMEWLDALKNVVEIAAIGVAGWWTYSRFIRNRLDHAHMDFDVGLKFIARHGDQWLVEVEALLENKGAVRQNIYYLEFSLRHLQPGDPLEAGGEAVREQTLIPNKADGGMMFPAKWEYAFMEPGTKQRFSFITHLPADAHAAMVWSRFFYERQRTDSNFHTAARLFPVPTHEPTEGRP